MHVLWVFLVIAAGCREMKYFPKAHPCSGNTCQIQIPTCMGNNCERPKLPSCELGFQWVPEKAKCMEQTSEN